MSRVLVVVAVIVCLVPLLGCWGVFAPRVRQQQQQEPQRFQKAFVMPGPKKPAK
jgi:hypothetical protein